MISSDKFYFVLEKKSYFKKIENIVIDQLFSLCMVEKNFAPPVFKFLRVPLGQEVLEERSMC